jgi:hypothetical protein
LLFDCNYGGKGTARQGNDCATLSKLCANSTKNAFGVVPQRIKNKAHRGTASFIHSMEWGFFIF